MVSPILLASDSRHGITLQPEFLANKGADLSMFYNAGVAYDKANPMATACGGIGETEEEASLAAIGEALERSTAMRAVIDEYSVGELPDKEILGPEEWSLFSDEQRLAKDFPFTAFYEDDHKYTDVYSLEDNTRHYAPVNLVTLRASHGLDFTTSNGLAAGHGYVHAMLRGLQELIERDAFMVAWRNGLVPQRLVLPYTYQDAVNERGGTVLAVDISPAYCSQKVVAVLGSIPKDGKPRYSLGIASRGTYEQAMKKAFMEWQQGVLFVGVRMSARATAIHSLENVTDFDAHALFYSYNPELWAKLPMWHALASKTQIKRYVRPKDMFSELQGLVKELASSGVEAFYKDLTSPEVAQLGVRVVRVLSPKLIPINSDANWPFVGGTISDVAFRFPGEKKSKLRLDPHPLG